MILKINIYTVLPDHHAGPRKSELDAAGWLALFLCFVLQLSGCLFCIAAVQYVTYQDVKKPNTKPYSSPDTFTIVGTPVTSPPDAGDEVEVKRNREPIQNRPRPAMLAAAPGAAATCRCVKQEEQDCSSADSYNNQG